MALDNLIAYEAFPRSPYAQQLKRGVDGLRFDGPLEEQFIAAHLRRVRARVRIWFSFSCALTSVLAVILAITVGVRSAPFWIHALGLVPCTAVLAWLGWSRHYERWYLPVARILVPLSGAAFAYFVADSAAPGRDEALAALTMNLVAAFVFSGLLFRAAVVAAATALVTFAVCAALFNVPHEIMAKAMIVVLLSSGIGGIVSRDVEQSQRKSFLEDAIIAELVARDSLSGLLNRRAFDEHLLRVWHQAQRDHRTLAILMIDIDHFKGYNDEYGHQAGDAALQAVASILSELARRPLDIAARYGGEEFSLILFDLSQPYVEDVAERARQAVQMVRVTDQLGAQRAGVTISVGIALVMPVIGRTPQGAIQLADEALYEAKRAGRNRVVLKGPDEYREMSTGLFRRPGGNRPP